MKIEHTALWVRHLEPMREFYARHFGATASTLYRSRTRDFHSCFLTFPAGGARLELMCQPAVEPSGDGLRLGYAHLALALGSEARVRDLTEALRQAGVPVVGEPRYTGDGYYESVVLDPEGNRIELTV